MRISMTAGVVLPLLALGLSGCFGTGHPAATRLPKSQAAELSIFLDSSGSTELISSPPYASAVISRASGEVMRLRLGDSVRVVSFGTRSADNAVDVLAIQSGYTMRLPAVRKRVEDALNGLVARNRATGGQSATDLTYALEQSAIRCSPGGRVVVLTDGLLENEQYSASKALSEGKAVHFPPPLTPYLSGGCSVEVLGVGMAPGAGRNAQTLPNDQMRNLEAGLREYFRTAGATDITFASVL